MANKKMPKNAENFNCELCDFTCSKKSNWTNHIATQKHKRLTEANKKMPLVEPQNDEHSAIYNCECGKRYKHYASLCKHRKICSDPDKTDECEPPIDEHISNEIMLRELNKEKQIISTEMVLELMKQNKDLQNALIEQNAKLIEMAKNHTVINNNNTTNNATFNLQFFLNEKCKDALNMIEFVNSIQFQLKDLEDAGKYGFVHAITNVFINGLNQLDVYKRPIHCTDLKRETLYVKNENEWVKETQDKKYLKQAVDKIAFRNLKQLKVWQQENPEYEDVDSAANDTYMRITSNALGGLCEEDEQRNKEKIMRNVMREVILDKDALVSRR
jgi:hypothetical protein